MRASYLDNNATTRVNRSVLQVMLPFFTDQFGNGSSMHSFGEDVSQAIRRARKQVQMLIGAEHDHEIIFTSGGTESDNTAILSALEAAPRRREIITSTVEHPAILGLCAHLERNKGYIVHRIGVDRQGRLDLEAYRAALSDRVAIVSLMWANNETGALFPVEELALEAKAVGALFHTDAVQAVGKIAIDVKSSAIDMLSLSGHKFHAPKGIGALYVRRGVRFKPVFKGGQQERGRRPGTENTPGIVGLGAAADIALRRLDDVQTRVKELRDRLEKGILQRVGRTILMAAETERLPNTSTIAFEFIEGEAILLHLSRAGVAASSGSACSSGSLEPSHVLRAMDIPFTAAHGAIRFSLSHETTERDVERVLDVVPEVIAKLRGLSPFWNDDRAAETFKPVYA